MSEIIGACVTPVVEYIITYLGKEEAIVILLFAILISVCICYLLKYRNVSKENNALKQEQENLKKENNELKIKNEKQKIEIKQLNKEIKQLEKENIVLRIENAKLEIKNVAAGG